MQTDHTANHTVKLLDSTLGLPHNPSTMREQRRRKLLHRLWRWPLMTMLVLTIVGVSYQLIGTVIDHSRYLAPGQQIDVGGYSLHLYCIGEGSPTVILDHVADTNSAQWALIQPVVATQTRVCAYDRAGFGWSDPGPAPRDAEQNARELHTLLVNAGLPGPYLVVGHSFGANVSRVYAARYPEEIAGLLLVDPGVSFDRPGVPATVNAAWKEGVPWVMRHSAWLARLGLWRLAGTLGALPGHGDLPAAQAAAFDALQLTTQFHDTLAAQGLALAATSTQVLAAESQLGKQPLLILSAAEPATNQERQVWTAVNATIAARVPHGVHRVVPGSDHMSLVLRHDHAQMTAAAILEMVTAVRSGQPLSP